MTTKTIAILAMATAMALAGCQPGTTPTSSSGSAALALQANLSPEAIRLQSAEQRILTLEQEQKAARDRVAEFAIQGGLIGAGIGGLLGNVTCRDCDSDERRKRTIGGALLGGAGGAAAGANQAQRQNLAAQRENALRRRLQVAGRQLSEVRSARQLAQQVAANNQRRLARVRADVAAGRAERDDLRLAQADAREDAKVVGSSLRAMSGAKRSLSGEEKLSATQQNIAQEEAATELTLANLRTAIRNSAL